MHSCDASLDVRVVDLPNTATWCDLIDEHCGVARHVLLCQLLSRGQSALPPHAAVRCPMGAAEEVGPDTALSRSRIASPCCVVVKRIGQAEDLASHVKHVVVDAQRLGQ